MTEYVAIRTLQCSDVEDHRTIRLSALKTEPEAFGSIYAVEVAWPIEQHATRLSSSLVIGAYVGSRIVGMIGLKRKLSCKHEHKGFMWGFYVEPDYRKQGVGRVLLTALLDAAKKHVEQIMLTVVENNAPAIALYEQVGFVRYGLEPRSLKDASGYTDQVLMALIFPATADWLRT
jgi:ribosomal protein S18 acetylase RimI-like enzyme